MAGSCCQWKHVWGRIWSKKHRAGARFRPFEHGLGLLPYGSMWGRVRIECSEAKCCDHQTAVWNHMAKWDEEPSETNDGWGGTWWEKALSK